ncbi:MAG: serine hydrolase [Longimicrobiales bacterium]
MLMVPSFGMAQSPGVAERGPDPGWLQYADPDESGFSFDGVDRVLEFGRRRGIAAGMVVHEGAVVLTWGDVARRFPVHSIRKSFLSALYGMVPGRIDLERTLADLEIDDRSGLSDVERSARVVDLISSRSGVYHPAAAEPAEMTEDRPVRGSAAPGERWWYNNWDFNAAGTAFERMTGEAVLDAIDARLARPLGMEDYRREHAFEARSEASDHPSFHFRMSTRDLARFGLLFARDGRWREEQLIPKDWVQESTTAHSETDLGGSQPTAYGYMWWVDDAGGFSARGYGGHVVAVYPEDDLVVVLRADTFHDRFVSNRGVALLLDRIREARRGPASPTAALRPLEVDGADGVGRSAVPAIDITRYVGDYGFGGEPGTVRVSASGDSLFVDYGEGVFLLHPAGGHRFVTDDSRDPLEFERDANGAVARVLSEPILYRAAASAAARGDTAAAVARVEEAVRVFPESPRAHVNLARAYLGTGRADEAAAQLDEALRLDPALDEAEQLRRSLRGWSPRGWLVAAGALLGMGWFVLRTRRRRGA